MRTIAAAAVAFALGAAASGYAQTPPGRRAGAGAAHVFSGVGVAHLAVLRLVPAEWARLSADDMAWCDARLAVLAAEARAELQRR